MGGLHEEPSALIDPAESVEHLPLLSKYNVFEVPNLIWYCRDVFIDGGLGVARKSAITFAIIDVAAVCEVARWFV